MAALCSSVALCWEKSTPGGMAPSWLVFISVWLVKQVCEINIYRVNLHSQVYFYGGGSEQFSWWHMRAGCHTPSLNNGSTIKIWLAYLSFIFTDADMKKYGLDWNTILLLVTILGKMVARSSIKTGATHVHTCRKGMENGEFKVAAQKKDMFVRKMATIPIVPVVPALSINNLHSI